MGKQGPEAGGQAGTRGQVGEQKEEIPEGRWVSRDQRSGGQAERGETRVQVGEQGPEGGQAKKRGGWVRRDQRAGKQRREVGG